MKHIKKIASIVAGILLLSPVAYANTPFSTFINALPVNTSAAGSNLIYVNDGADKAISVTNLKAGLATSSPYIGYLYATSTATSTMQGTLQLNTNLNIGTTTLQTNGFGSGLYQFQISSSSNDVVGGGIFNTSTGSQAAAGFFLNGANTPLTGTGLAGTYYGGMAFAGPNFNGTPLGLSALPANGMAVYVTDGHLVLGSATSTGAIDFYVGANSFLAATQDMILNNNGFLGIATTSPYAPLSVGSVGGIVTPKIYATSTIATSTFAGSVMLANANNVITPSGNIVVIGTTTPNVANAYVPNSLYMCDKCQLIQMNGSKNNAFVQYYDTSHDGFGGEEHFDFLNSVSFNLGLNALSAGNFQIGSSSGKHETITIQYDGFATALIPSVGSKKVLWATKYWNGAADTEAFLAMKAFSDSTGSSTWRIYNADDGFGGGLGGGNPCVDATANTCLGREMMRVTATSTWASAFNATSTSATSTFQGNLIVGATTTSPTSLTVAGTGITIAADGSATTPSLQWISGNAINFSTTNPTGFYANSNNRIDFVNDGATVLSTNAGAINLRNHSSIVTVNVDSEHLTGLSWTSDTGFTADNTNAPQNVPFAASVSGVTQIILAKNSEVGIATTSPYGILAIQPMTSTSTPLLNIASSTNATMFMIDDHGHNITGGGSPTINSCGSSAAIQGDDSTMRVTGGGGVLTSCVINFATTWTKSDKVTQISPACIPTDEAGTAAALDATSTPTTVTIFGGSLTSVQFTLNCHASDNFTY